MTKPKTKIKTKKALRTQESIKKEFISVIKTISYKTGLSSVFSDWLEMCAISLRQLPYNSQQLPKDDFYEDYEKKYLEITRRYDKDQLNKMCKLMALTTESLGQHLGDFIGSIITSLELTTGGSSYFPTPLNLALATAKISMSDMKSQIEKDGIIIISEPSCGTGVMILATAEVALEQGVDPRANLQFQAIDINRDCFNATYIQLSLLGLQAVVCHGNALSDELWEERATPQLVFFEEWRKQFIIRCEDAQLFINTDYGNFTFELDIEYPEFNFDFTTDQSCVVGEIMSNLQNISPDNCKLVGYSTEPNAYQNFQVTLEIRNKKIFASSIKNISVIREILVGDSNTDVKIDGEINKNLTQRFNDFIPNLPELVEQTQEKIGNQIDDHLISCQINIFEAIQLFNNIDSTKLQQY